MKDLVERCDKLADTFNVDVLIILGVRKKSKKKFILSCKRLRDCQEDYSPEDTSEGDYFG